LLRDRYLLALQYGVRGANNDRFVALQPRNDFDRFAKIMAWSYGHEFGLAAVNYRNS
jgi:hypothetical protein